MSENMNKMPSNKKFGNFFSLIFFISFVYSIYNFSLIISLSFLILSIITFVIANLASNILTPFNLLWFKIGMTLNYFISPIILGIIFFGLITPLGLFLKLFKRDELKLKIQNNKSSWKLYKKNKLIKNHFYKQF